MKFIGRRKKEDQTKNTSDVEVVSSESTIPKTSRAESSGTELSLMRKTVIIRPIVTEKAAHLADMGKYVFEVASKAGRVEVQQAIMSIYGIRPVSVNTQNVRAKTVRFGRHSGKQKTWKKAIVMLPKGKKIDVHEGV